MWVLIRRSGDKLLFMMIVCPLHHGIVGGSMEQFADAPLPTLVMRL